MIDTKFTDGDKVWTIKGYGTVIAVLVDNESVFYTVELDGGHGIYQFIENEIEGIR